MTTLLLALQAVALTHATAAVTCVRCTSRGV
jgi:hypothetical protein